MPTPSEIAEHRRANQGIAALVERDLEAFWATLNLTRPESARDELLAFLPILMTEYGEIAATVAADWFDELRIEAVASGLFVATGAAATYTATLAPVTPAAVIQKQVRFGAQHLFTDNPDQTLVFLKGEATKYALQPGRDTITRNAGRDPQARGWQRFTRAGSCKFCRMLSSRGGVYTNASSHFSAHHHCNCVSAPTWDPTGDPVDVAAEFVASRETSKLSPEARENLRARTAAYLARFEE